MKVREGRTSGQAEEEDGTQIKCTRGRTDVPLSYGQGRGRVLCTMVCERDPLDNWARDKEEGQDLPSSGGKTRKRRGGGGVTT